MVTLPGQPPDPASSAGDPMTQAPTPGDIAQQMAMQGSAQGPTRPEQMLLQQDFMRNAYDPSQLGVMPPGLMSSNVVMPPTAVPPVSAMPGLTDTGLGDAASQVRTALEQAAMFGQSISRSLEEALRAAQGVSQAVQASARATGEAALATKQTAQAHHSRVRELVEAGGAVRIAEDLEHRGPGRGGAPAPHPHAPAEGRPDPATPTPGGRPKLDPHSLLTRGGIERNVAQQALSFLEKRIHPNAPDLYQDPDTKEYRHRDDDHVATEDEVDRFHVADRARSRALGGLRDVAAGRGTLAAGLGATARTVLPAVGWAYAGYRAVEWAGHEMEDQRRKNQVYQQISGDSNFSGFAQRGHEGMFALSQFGTMGGAQARELFRGVTSMGLTGPGRQDALDFATREFKKYGMDISDSLGLLNTALSSGVTNFDSLRGAIDDVSKAAKEGGRNVQQVQQMFGQNYAAVTQNVTQGDAAPALASALTSASAALPRDLQGINYMGLTNPSIMRQLAQQSGMSYGQFIGATHDNPLTFTNAANKFVMQRVGLSAPQGALSWIQQQAQQDQHGRSGISQAEAQHIASQAEQQFNMDPQQIVNILQASGIQGVTTANAAEYLVAAATGNTGMVTGGYMQDQQQRAALTTAGRANGGVWQGSTAASGGAAVTGGRYSGKRFTQGEVGLAGQFGMSQSDLAKFGARSGTRAHEFINYNNFLNQHKGARNAAFEALIGPNNADYDKNARYVVKTKDGDREVTLNEGMQHYADQFARGDVYIDKGKNAGKTVADVVGPQALDPNTPLTSDTKKGHGRKVKDPAGGNILRVEAAPELQRLLTLSASGGISVDTARRTGVPASAFPAAYNLPTADPGGS